MYPTMFMKTKWVMLKTTTRTSILERLKAGGAEGSRGAREERPQGRDLSFVVLDSAKSARVLS